MGKHLSFDSDQGGAGRRRDQVNSARTSGVYSFQASQPALEPSVPHHVELAQAAAVGTAAAVAGDAPV